MYVYYLWSGRCFQSILIRQNKERWGFLKYFLVVMILAFFSAEACFAVEAAVAAPQAVLTVEVTNGTANGTTVTDDMVSVRVYEHGQLLRTLESTVSADGVAVFENVSIGDHTVALARAKHQDMMFNGRPVTLRPREKEFFALVQVFDVSDDMSNLSIGTHHLIIKAHPVLLEITEYMQLKNSSDMAVTSKERDNQNRPVVLEIILPKGFKNLRFSGYFEDDAVLVTEKGFYDTMAVPPGEYQAAFSYTIEITSDTIDIVKEISLPTSNFVVFAELGQAKLQGLGQSENQLIRTNGVPMEYYKRSNLAPAEKIAFQITGFNVNRSALGTWVILAVVFGAIVVLAVSRLRSKET